ncbi:MAG: NAD(P)/FAD-dependent oxidoreductase [Longimonas sp.]|uniref:NAD(P)/FAD-dependent oxidoreductase n=1 Tax=Longimonas sp. TaxID=2039626 RepID=UPI0039762180
MIDVAVVGGGLAGCSVAIQMARAGHEVVVFEAGSYPRHKLCGEFLSPEAQSSLDRLGVRETLEAHHPPRIDQSVVTAPGGATDTVALPAAAWGISRYVLDALLAKQAESAGATVRTGCRVSNIEGTLDTGFTVTHAQGTTKTRTVVGAWGKHGIPDRTLGRTDLTEPDPVVAFKAHYGGDMPPVIDIHAFPGGYCGCSPVEEGRFNVCWIGRRDALQHAGSPEGMLQAAADANPHLAERLEAGTRCTDFCAVSQVTLDTKGPLHRDVCMVGDTAAMIAPLCGDGMAMALHAADVLVPHLHRFLAGQQAAATLRTRYASDWHAAFDTRLQWGRWVHRIAFRPGVARAVVTGLRLLPPLHRWVFRQTRGPLPA